MDDSTNERMCENYDIFSFIYRELITATGHLEQQQNLLKLLVLEHGINAKASILDAACGTGDSLIYLSKCGFSKLYGIDGSVGMLRKAMARLHDVIFECCSWSQLNRADIFVNKQMDFVFMLSNSLAHAGTNSIPGIIKNLYSNISDGGVLVLDTRDWNMNCKGNLIEPNRPVNQRRYLATVFAEGREWNILDLCSYDAERQWITYYCETANTEIGDSRLIEIPVSYARVTANEIADVCGMAGFQTVRVRHCPPWPYVLIEATKS